VRALTGRFARVAAGARAGSGETGRMARGILRIYLGAAPGVGKTYATLDEAP